MKAVIRTIIVCVTLNLMTAGFVPAQDVADEEIHKALDMQAKEAGLARKEAEIAAKLVQKQAEAAQKQMEAAEKQIQARLRQVAVAQQNLPRIPEPVVPMPPMDRMSTGFAGTWSSRRSSSTGTVLVIPAAEFKTEDLLTISDDISVMSRIFEKNLQQAHIAPVGTRLFISSNDVLRTFFGRGGGAIQTMYLQGYGALFLMKVDFPLSPPLQVEEEKETKEGEADPVWERTKREMYEPEETRRRRADQPEQKYDTEKIENLKTILVKTLKHAANIRALKPDESVILAVTGSSESAGGITAIATTKIVGHEDHNTRIVEELAPRGSSPTMIVIRAKKSDIDGFAKAELDFDQFRQRTQILTCPHFGGGARRGDLFGDYFRRARR